MPVMQTALYAEVVMAFLIGGGLAGMLGWIWGATRARATADAALRESEKRASAAAARADELANQARQADGRANGLEAARRLADVERAASAAHAEELERSLAEQRELLAAAKTQLGDTFHALAA